MCYLGWAGEDCNSTSPLSYLVVGPTVPVSGSDVCDLTIYCLYPYLSSTHVFCTFFSAFSTSSLSVILLKSHRFTNPFHKCCYAEYSKLFICFFVDCLLHISLFSVHVCSLKPAAFVFTEPCMSFFLFVIIFTLILCRQADVFDGVT